MYNVHVVSLFSTHTIYQYGHDHTHNKYACHSPIVTCKHMNLQGGMTLRMLFTHYNSSHVYKCKRISYTSFKKCLPDEQVRDMRWLDETVHPKPFSWRLRCLLEIFSQVIERAAAVSAEIVTHYSVPQSCHSGKRWIWILEALSNTNPSKKLTVPTISGFTMGHPQLATRLYPFKVAYILCHLADKLTLIRSGHINR